MQRYTNKSFSHFISSGTLSLEQTIESSSSVRVTEKNLDEVAHEGMGSFASIWQTDRSPVKRIKTRANIKTSISNRF